MALLFLDEMIGSRRDDEYFVVFHHGDFERSVRAELPPVRGRDGTVAPAEPGESDWRA